MEDMTITLTELLDIASGLKSEDGENPEYDRALVEVCCNAAGMSTDSRDIMERALGVKS
jgi:hypothetical protein